MTRDELLNRISINSQVCFGKPCIKGRRIWVSLVLDFLASGMSVERIMEEYDIEREDVLACIAYGAEMSRERYIDIPVEAAP
jgi:uncharacterized protein (DUF433 family)